MRVPHVSERIKEAPAQALRGVFAGIGQLLLVTDKLRNKPAAKQDVPLARTPQVPETITDTSVTVPGDQDAGTAAAEPAAAPEPDVAKAPPAGTGAATAAPAAAAPAKPARARRSPAKPTTPKPATPKVTAAKPAKAKPAAKAATARQTPAKAATGEAAAEAPTKPPERQSTRDFDKTGNVRLLGEQADSATPGAAAPEAAKPAAAAPEPTAAAPEPAAAAAAEPAAAEPVSVAETAAAGAPLANYDELSVASLRARLRNLDVAQVRQLAEYERAHAARADVLIMFERRIAKLEAGA
jgi:predicted flap endonuclease-1-like 5' DNA nuclease